MSLFDDRSDVRPIESCHRATPSSDGRYIAVVTPNYELDIWSVLNTYEQSDFIHIRRLIFPQTLRSLLINLTLLRWGPSPNLSKSNQKIQELSNEPRFILLTDGNRLVFTAVQFDDTRDIVQDAKILADINTGDQFGKTTLAEFVFDHQHVLLLTEMNVQGSIVSFDATLSRHDIPNVKFNDSRALAVTAKRVCALLLRSKGQDRVVVCSSLHRFTRFNISTIDAQGLQWSPDSEPLLAVWDSAAYGVKVCFYTALGHALKQLEISPSSLGASALTVDIANVGISCFTWTHRECETFVACGDGSRRVYVRRQLNRKMEIDSMTAMIHPKVIDGAKFIVWHEAPETERGFTLEKAAFETDRVPDTPGDVESIDFNINSTFLVTRLVSEPKILWLWQPEFPDPHTVITFREPVKQVLWHPKLENVLLVMTQQKIPTIYAWHMETRPPLIVRPDQLRSITSTKWEAKWLAEDSSGSHPLLISTLKSFAVGGLEPSEFSLGFSSLMREVADMPSGLMTDDETTQMIDTPSKPYKGGLTDPKPVCRMSKSSMITPNQPFRW